MIYNSTQLEQDSNSNSNSNSNDTLLIDIGNSNTEYSTYTTHSTSSRSQLQTNTDEKIKNIQNIETNLLDNSNFLQEIHQFKKCVISSVVPQKDNLFKSHQNAVFITHDTIPIIKPDLENNQEIGADRLVNALGGYVLFNPIGKIPQKNILVVDSGTALTFCYITKEGLYKGGIIFPGLKLSSLALTEYTAKIPLTYVSPTDKIIGNSTKEAVEIGLYQGFIHMINGFIEQYKEQDTNLVVIGTGKGLEIMKDKLKLDLFDPQLIHKGLAYVSDNIN